MIKKDIANIYKILDNTYNVDEFIQKENKLKAQEKVLRKQEVILQDCRKVIRGQNRFFKEVTKTNEQTGHIEDIETHYAEAKIREKELKEQVRDEDKALMVQHAEVQLMRDRIRKIRQYVGEK